MCVCRTSIVCGVRLGAANGGVRLRTRTHTHTFTYQFAVPIFVGPTSCPQQLMQGTVRRTKSALYFDACVDLVLSWHAYFLSPSLTPAASHGLWARSVPIHPRLSNKRNCLTVAQ